MLPWYFTKEFFISCVGGVDTAEHQTEALKDSDMQCSRGVRMLSQGRSFLAKVRSLMKNLRPWNVGWDHLNGCSWECWLCRYPSWTLRTHRGDPFSVLTVPAEALPSQGNQPPPLKSCLHTLTVRLITKAKSNHNRAWDMLSLMREQKHYIPKKWQELARSYYQQPEEYSWDWALKIFNQGIRI